MADTERPLTRFIRRLRREERGNAMVIMGMALIPITGMIGSGLDLSRAYMAKTRLQNACDAGALAGRRAMTNDVLTPQARAEALKFFNFNFAQQQYGTASFTPQVTRPARGTVRITASTTIPTAVMKLFGNDSIDLDVDCDATLNMVNTDVVLVLDVTGSMDQTLGGTKKIAALREAVMAFYDELAPVQTQLEAAGMRLRYGIVPYSANVNVGKLVRAVNSSYITNTNTYQTRIPVFYTATQETVAGLTETQCNNREQAKTPGGDVYPATEKFTSWSTNRRNSSCVITTVTYNTTATGQFAERYLHVAAPLNVSAYKMGSNVAVPSRLPGTTQNATWAGCLEERDTVDTIRASSGYAIPTGAHDLNIDLIPNSDATRWRPVWPEVSYQRFAEIDDTIQAADDGDENTIGESDELRSNVTCPAEAVRLKAFSRSDMQSYVNALTPTGSTYHDIGMIWGARLISKAGIFADSPDTFNGMPATRHIIFMTDGELAPTDRVYSTYGMEKWDQRVTGNFNADGQYASHEQRFKMICNAIKGRNVSIWAIAFGTTASAAMTECASNPNQVRTADQKDQLIATFRELGRNIGALRLDD